MTPIENEIPAGDYQQARLAADRNQLEDHLIRDMRSVKLLAWEREYQFHETRKWRFDFAWPELALAVEAEGGTYSGGAHVRPEHFESDCEKYNTAAILGWSVLRFTSKMITDGRAIQAIAVAIESRLQAAGAAAS